MSLRLRLTIYYTIFFALALLLVDIGMYIGARQLLVSSVRDELLVGTTLIQQDYQSENRALSDPAAIDIVRLRPPQIRDVEAPELYVQIADTSDVIVGRSANLRGDRLPLSQAQVAMALQGKSATAIGSVGSARVLSQISPLRINGRVVGVIQVAQSLRLIDRSLRTLLGILVAGGLVALLAAARGSLWLAGQTLQPIERIGATAERILRASDLKERVPETPSMDELGRLARTINRMIERMERMFTAQERFTADVAHDLRTPLAAMRGNLEILRRGAARDPALLDESLRDVESEVLRLTRMANDLLVLAQADAGVPLHMGPIQLDEIVLEVYRELRSLAGEHPFRVDLDEQVAIVGDRDRIKQALLNLVANAFQHTPARCAVTLGLHEEDGYALLTVADIGPGIPTDQQVVLFERFYQADRARSQGGAGLGLAIVRWVAEAHDGTIQADSRPSSGTTFTLRLPVAGPLAQDRTKDASGHTSETAVVDVHAARPGDQPHHQARTHQQQDNQRCYH